MLTADTAREIVGIIGNVISFALFISPVPTFITIWKKKAVEDFSPIPYLATILSCMMWVFYGIPQVTPNSVLVVTINTTGVALEAIYLTIFVVYATPAGRRKVFTFLSVEVLFVAAVVVGVLMGEHTHERRTLIVGVLCVIITICMYASPLAAMRDVVRTKSIEYMPFSLSLASFLNAVCWTIYALICFDIFITIPNGLGTLLGFVQLVLYSCYCGSTRREGPKSEVQLPVTAPSQGNNGGLSDVPPR